MSAPLFAFLAALIIGGGGGLLALARSKFSAGAAVATGLITGILIFFIDWGWLFYHRPAMIAPGLISVIFFDVLILLIVAFVVDLATGAFDAAAPVALCLLLAVVGYWTAGYNSGHNAHRAAFGIVHVTEEFGHQGQKDTAVETLPASTTSNLVIVTPAMAQVKASNAMSTGEAGTRNFSSYLDLGPATLQMVAGHMWYAFPLQFQGAINKHRLNKHTTGMAQEPGYLMVSGEDPNASVIERYAPDFPKASMVVSLGAGQGAEPDRWAYSHGYSHYVLDDPTLEIADDGTPYYTVALNKPQLGWTFPAPVGVLLINAHTGQITRYSLPGRGLPNPVPSWVDRVYGQQTAESIVNWYGFYGHAPFGGQGNSNRYQVSGAPVMVYTGDGHPSWRMLLTSFTGNETSVSRIIEMDSHSGAIQAYRPSQPMGIESTVGEAFASGSGVGAQLIKANHYTAANLSLHIIYGHLTWMASYEPQGNHPSFTGVGFLDAYRASAANVAFGSSRAQALSNYLQQLTSEQNANGTTPGAGGQDRTITGTIADKRTDTQGGNSVYYLTLNGANGKPDTKHVYTGTSQLGSAIVESNPGDHVIIRVLKITQQGSQLTMQSFSDREHPLVQAGSGS